MTDSTLTKAATGKIDKHVLNHNTTVPRNVRVTASFPASTTTDHPTVQGEALRVIKEKISEIVQVEFCGLEVYGHEEGYVDSHVHLHYSTLADKNDNCQYDLYDIFDHVYPLFEKYPTLFVMSPVLKDWHTSSREELVGRESKSFRIPIKEDA